MREALQYQAGKGVKLSAQLNPDAQEYEFRLLQQMGVQYCYTWIRPEQMNNEFMENFQDQCRAHDLVLYNMGIAAYGKSADIQLGLEHRDQHIEKFREWLELLGRYGVYTTTITWEPNCAWCTTADGQYGRNLFSPAARGGALTRVFDASVLEGIPYSHKRKYGREEIWRNFEYFIRKVIPTAEAAGVRIALHPNDPPLPSSAGIDTFIRTADDYRRAFEIAKSDCFGMEFCIGCWLEGGRRFGKLKSDIREFVRDGKVFIVHFRNVSGTLPFFVETFVDDGYGDMYELMKILVESGYNGTLVYDHVPVIEQAPHASEAYAIGYIKGLLEAAGEEVSG